MIPVPNEPSSGGSTANRVLQRQFDTLGHGGARSGTQFRSSADFGPAMTSLTRSTSSASEETSSWSHDYQIFPTTRRDPDPSSHQRDLWPELDDAELPAIVDASGLGDFHAHYPRRERTNSDSSLTDATRPGSPPASSSPDYMAALEEFRTEGARYHKLFQRLSRCRNIDCGSSSVGIHNICTECRYIHCAGCLNAEQGTPGLGPLYLSQRTSCCSFARAVVLLHTLDELDRVAQRDNALINNFLELVVQKVNLRKVVTELRLSIVSTETVDPFNNAVRNFLRYDLLGTADDHESTSFIIRRSFLPLLVHVLLHDLTTTEHTIAVYQSLAELLVVFLSTTSLQDILIEPFVTVLSLEQMGLHEWFRQGFPNTKYDLNAAESLKMFHRQELNLGEDISLADDIVGGLESMGEPVKEVVDLWKSMMRMWIQLFDGRKKPLPLTVEGHRSNYMP